MKSIEQVKMDNYTYNNQINSLIEDLHYAISKLQYVFKEGFICCWNENIKFID